MSLLIPLPNNAPKKWIKQEIQRLKFEILQAQDMIKHHANLRQQAGVFTQITANDSKLSQSPKLETKDSWGVKLSYSHELPKKRGRPRKSDFDLSQTRIVFYRNLPNP